MKTRTAVRLCMVAGVLTLLAAGVRSAGAESAPAPRHIVVLDQSGRGYAPTRLFQVNPRKPWGIAYAFDCGGRAGSFGGDVWEVVNAVELPYTAFSGQGRSGHGLRMETGSTSTINAPNGTPAGRVLGLRIKTPCAWHVRVVLGKRPVVARHIPTHA